MADRGDFVMEEPDEDDVRNNNYVMSLTDSVGPLSFVDDRQPFEMLAPPPKYINDEMFLKDFTGPTDTQLILKDFVVDEQGYFVVTNEDIIAR